MVVVKWFYNMEGSGDEIVAPLCGGLYKEQDVSIIPWSGTDPDSSMNFFMVQE